MVADVGVDIFHGRGIGPLAKWVDDHIFFRLPCGSLLEYNACHVKWQQEIQEQGGCIQNGGRCWYRGKNLPSGVQEEFDKNCSAILQDLAETSPRMAEDQLITYTDADIDKLSEHLGIRWEPSKSTPFSAEVPYLGFSWNLCT